MLKQRRLVAEQVAESLFAAEAAIDAALACTAKLAGQMPAVRGDANLSALIGQGAIEQAIQAMAALSQARGRIVATHNELSIAQNQMGLGSVRLDGGGGEKPSNAEMLPMARHLRSIEAVEHAA